MRRACIAGGLALVLGGSASLAAPAKAPVVWQATARKAVKAGTRFAVPLVGAMDPGWHLYALEEPQGGPIATVIALTEGDAADLLQVQEGHPSIVADPAFGVATGYFAGTATFTLQLRMAKDAPAGVQPLHVLVRYQSCNDTVCLPPRTDTVEVAVTVRP